MKTNLSWLPGLLSFSTTVHTYSSTSLYDFLALQRQNVVMQPYSQSSLLTGIAIGATVTAGWFLFQNQNGRRNNGGSRRRHNTKASSTPSIPAELREEQLSRHTLYFGEAGIQKIRKSRVCVVGLGGVGSHTAVMLARGGVEYLKLIDFDQVTLSSLNRHACATLNDVGIPKVVCVQRFMQMLGITNVDAVVEMYTAETGPNLLRGHWDIVIDCIDDVPTKASLLAYCVEQKIRVFSCMGAGGKSDFTRLHISDLRTAAKDPLASKLRQTIRRTTKKNPAIPDDSYLDDMDQLTIIYSSEKTVAKLADLTEEQKQQGDKTQFGAVDGMRIRVLPVLGPLPAIMGQALASMALCELGNKPILQPVTGERLGKNVRHRKLQHLKNREDRIQKGEISMPDTAYKGPIQVDIDDMEYILGVWRNCCAVTGARLGTTLELVRWDVTKPATTDNLVVMSMPAILAYDAKGKASIPENIQIRIDARLALCRDQNGQLF